MSDDTEHRGSTTLDGFRVLWVGIKREPIVFTVATLGAVLFGVLTVADAWVLGWATQHVLIPAFETGDEVTVLYVEGALVRVTTGDRFGWVAPTALTATDPTPEAAPTGATPEFSMEALQQLLDRTKAP